MSGWSPDVYAVNAAHLQPNVSLFAGCMYLQFGEEYVMNITFTQNTYNGFTVVWDHNEWEEGTTPGENSD